jgi:tRNA(fMet)-specific endonuclease VapC
LAVAAVTIAEYRVGIELADTPDRAADRARALVAITSAVEVLDYTETTAACHARLIAHFLRAGSPRGAHDLMIAAHAVQTGRTIVALDAKARFADLPGVSATER